MVQTKYYVSVRWTFRWASEQQSCSAKASMIVRIPSPQLTKKIIFVCTVFLSFTLRMPCERTLIHAHQHYEPHHKICNLRYETLVMGGMPDGETMDYCLCNFRTARPQARFFISCYFMKNYIVSQAFRHLSQSLTFEFCRS